MPANAWLMSRLLLCSGLDVLWCRTAPFARCGAEAARAIEPTARDDGSQCECAPDGSFSSKHASPWGGNEAALLRLGEKGDGGASGGDHFHAHLILDP